MRPIRRAKQLGSPADRVLDETRVVLDLRLDDLGTERSAQELVVQGVMVALLRVPREKKR